jgi:hypothetical protein
MRQHLDHLLMPWLLIYVAREFASTYVLSAHREFVFASLFLLSLAGEILLACILDVLEMSWQTMT